MRGEEPKARMEKAKRKAATPRKGLAGPVRSEVNQRGDKFAPADRIEVEMGLLFHDAEARFGAFGLLNQFAEFSLKVLII